MLLNILRRLRSGRVARNTDSIRILINPHIIKPHCRRHHRRQTAYVQKCKRFRHPKVHDKRHGFGGDDALAYVAVWPESPRVEFPGFILADEPGYFTFGPGFVFERVDLVEAAIVPVVVYCCYP